MNVVTISRGSLPVLKIYTTYKLFIKSIQNITFVTAVTRRTAYMLAIEQFVKGFYLFLKCGNTRKRVFVTLLLQIEFVFRLNTIAIKIQAMYVIYKSCNIIF